MFKDFAARAAHIQQFSRGLFTLYALNDACERGLAPRFEFKFQPRWTIRVVAGKIVRLELTVKRIADRVAERRTTTRTRGIA